MAKSYLSFTYVVGASPIKSLNKTGYLRPRLDRTHTFLIARSIQLENGGFPSTECKNLLYLLDMSSKLYKMNFLDKIDKMKFIK